MNINKIILVISLFFATLATSVAAQSADSSDVSSAEASDALEMPKFPGGDKALREYFSQNVSYPKAACEQKIEGRVFVRFIVDTDGKVSNVGVAQSLDASLDAEAVRLVSSMPNWIPGRKGGEAVRVVYTLPVNFKL